MQAFILDAENFSSMQEALDEQLTQAKIEQKEALRAELLVEEIFWRMVNFSKVEQVKVQVVKKFFGGVSIQMSSQGSPYNPLVEVSDWDEEDEEYYRTMILKANRQNLSWSHKNNRNVITISVSNEKNLQLKLTLTGMTGGIVCGVAMREIFSPETVLLIREMIIEPPEKIFMNALGLLIAPVIFFSIINGIIGMDKSAGVDKIGLKLMSLSLTSMIAATLVSSVVAWIFFSEVVPQINTLPAAVETSAESYNFSLIKFIVDIIPGDFVSPILHGNTLQIIFIAVLFGISVNTFGDKVSTLKTLLNNLNDVFAKMISMVMFFVPPIVFFAMMTLALDLKTEMIMTISKLIIGQIVAAVAMFVLYQIFVWRGKISFKPFAKKILPALPPTFATCNSFVVMPEMMNICTKGLGISSKISSFAIPVGVIVNMAGAPINFITSTVMFIKVYGIEFDLQTLVLVALLSLALSFGVPTVPAAAVICIVTIAGYFGVPKEVAGLLFCIDALSDRILTCVNVVANMAVATVLAQTENLLDEKIYLS